MKLRDKEIRAFGFDMDGTLIDTDRVNDRATVATCEYYNIPLKPEVLTSLRGMSNPHVFRAICEMYDMGDLHSITKLSQYKREYYLKHIHEAKHIHGAVEFVRRVRREGAVLSIATAASNESLNASLLVLGLRREEFAVLLPADSVVGKLVKPDPHHWQETIRLSGVPPENFVIVEDSVKGMQSAASSGGHAVGILTTHTRDELVEAGATLVVESYDELAEIIGLRLE